MRNITNILSLARITFTLQQLRHCDNLNGPGHTAFKTSYTRLLLGTCITLSPDLWCKPSTTQVWVRFHVEDINWPYWTPQRLFYPPAFAHFFFFGQWWLYAESLEFMHRLQRLSSVPRRQIQKVWKEGEPLNLNFQQGAWCWCWTRSGVPCCWENSQHLAMKADGLATEDELILQNSWDLLIETFQLT